MNEISQSYTRKPLIKRSRALTDDGDSIPTRRSSRKRIKTWKAKEVSVPEKAADLFLKPTATNQRKAWPMDTMDVEFC